MNTISSAIFDVERAYDLAAHRYDTWKWQEFWRAHEAPFVLHHVQRGARRSNLKLLDLGCGTGYYLAANREHFTRSAGIDVSQEMLSVARKQAPSARLEHGSLESIPTGEDFDVIIATRVISHVADWRGFLTSTRRLLRRKGMLVLTGIHSQHPYHATKLPTDNGPIYTSTFKHPEEDVFDHLQQQGFSGLQFKEICGNGTCGENMSSRSAPVGWASAMQLS